MPTRRTKRAPTHLQIFVQRQIRELLGSGTYPTQSALAEAMGVSQAHVSQAREGSGIGNVIIRGLAKVRGVPHYELMRQAEEEGERAGKQPELFRVPPADRRQPNEQLPGWAKAEKEARRYANLPDWTFLVARGRTGIVPWQGVTRDYVISEAVTALTYAKPEDAVTRTNEEADRKAEALAKKAKRKKPNTDE
jgi:transcriptional regulator with XRE-family HTH domain